MNLFHCLLALSLLSCAIAFQNTGKIRGINLGGWFVLEPFLNPSFLTTNPPIYDEYTYCSYYQNESIALNRLQNHWATWVSENDIRILAKAGMTHYRIPVGYWIVMEEAELRAYNEPWLGGGWSYLVRALQWIKKYNGKAIIDIHALPGHQNPWPHSGRMGSVSWGTGDTMQRSYETVRRLAQKIAKLEDDPSVSQVVVGLEVMNEALPSMIIGGISTVHTFYLNAYNITRQYLNENYMYIIEEAFSPDTFIGFMSNESYQNVVLDVHTYQCFDEGLRMSSRTAHLQIACAIGRDKVLRQTLPVFTGEWSVAYKTSSDGANTEPYPDFTERVFLQQYALAQMNAFDHGIGWFWWNFKTESAPMWDWFLGTNGGWLPCSVPTAYSDNICPALQNYTWIYYQCDDVHPSSTPVIPPTNTNTTGEVNTLSVTAVTTTTGTITTTGMVTSYQETRTQQPQISQTITNTSIPNSSTTSGTVNSMDNEQVSTSSLRVVSDIAVLFLVVLFM